MTADVRVVALTLGLETPSARYRVRQHIPALSDLGVDVRELHPRSRSAPRRWARHRVGRPVELASDALARLPHLVAARSADVVWMTKWLVPGHLTMERRISHHLVLDVDDAIWCRGPRAARAVAASAEVADHVIAGNEFLADWFAARTRTPITIVPTAVDTLRYLPARTTANDRPVIGWIGTARNLHYLQTIDRALAQAVRETKARLVVVADVQPTFEHVPAEAIEFRQWDPAREPQDLASFDVGIMPLLDGEWERGKCGFKALQYMASGVPFVASPVGMNVDLIASGGGLAATTDAQWRDHLVDLLTDRDRAAIMGSTGRATAESHFSVRALSSQLGSVLRSVAGS